MVSGPEAKYSRKVQDYLQSMGYYVVKYHGDRYSVKGTPDLLCCIEGRFVGLELKTKGKKATDLQKVKGEDIKRSKGYWFVVENDVSPEQILYTILAKIYSKEE